MFKAELISNNKVWGRGSFYDTELEAQEWLNRTKIKLEKQGYEVAPIGPIDLSLDKEYMHQQKVNERKAKYAEFKDEILEALLEKEQNKPQKLVEVLAKYQKIKTDIPLPEKNK